MIIGMIVIVIVSYAALSVKAAQEICRLESIDQVPPLMRCVLGDKKGDYHGVRVFLLAILWFVYVAVLLIDAFLMRRRK